ncbi:MAG TPA: ABC transporter ATP-binding protein [Mycobacteriales bacterium]|nr:ABC transporter ATP-binding protein [Mycobacteriales bacterium]
MTVDAAGGKDLLVDEDRRRAGRGLLAQLVREHRNQAIGAVAAVLTSTGALLLMPLMVKHGIDVTVKQHRFGPLAVALTFFLIAALADYVAQLVAQRLVGQIAETSTRDLRVRLFTHVMHQPLAFFERLRTGRVVARLTSDLDALYELLGQAAVAVIGNLLLLVGIATVMIVLDWVLALVVLAIVPLLIVLTTQFGLRARDAYQQVRERVGAVITAMTEVITGVRVVQAFAREKRSRHDFAQVNEAYRDANAETVMLMSVFGPGVEMIGQIAIVLVLVVGGTRALHTDHPALYVGTLTAFVLYLRSFFDPLQELSQFYNSWHAATAAAVQVAGVLDTTTTVPEPAAPVALPAGNGEVRLSGVSFAYSADLPEVLHDVDLVVPGGTTLALIGSTGAGKSTIAKLAARFYDPVRGAVALDGVDLRDIAGPELRRAVAVVTQEPFLFAGSVADNVRVGRPDATDAEVEAACRAVGVHDVVAGLPEGYATDVSRRGARLSAGQRQLLAFARVWLADPRVLVLDEATSALDLPSERLVQRALGGLLADRTAIVIAHRYSSLEIADAVAVVEGGRIVEHGKRAALLRGDTRFAALHRDWLASLGRPVPRRTVKKTQKAVRTSTGKAPEQDSRRAGRTRTQRADN